MRVIDQHCEPRGASFGESMMCWVVLPFPSSSDFIEGLDCYQAEQRRKRFCRVNRFGADMHVLNDVPVQTREAHCICITTRASSAAS